MRKGLKVNLIAWAAAAAILAAAVPVNLIFNKMDVNVDVTPYNAYSLSEQAEKALGSMEKPVDMYVLYKLDKLYDDVTPGESEYMMADMFVKTIRQMDEYDKINLHEVDIEENPDFVDEMDPEGLMNLSSADVLLKCDDQVRNIDFLSMFSTNKDTGSIEFYGENYILGAIDYLESGVTPTIYWTTGHGEKTTDEYTNLIKQLKGQNYDAKTLDLTQTESIPDDATTVMMAAPKEDISDDERDMLLDYMSDGGNITLLMSPNDEKMQYTNIEKLMATYNIAMDYNKVYETETDYCAEGDKYTIMCEFTDVDFNQGLKKSQGELQLYMPASRSFYSTAEDDDQSGIEVKPLVQTLATAQSESCGSTDSDAIVPSGILNLAAYGEDPARNNSKIFVCGSAEFMDDKTVADGYTILAPYLFLSTVSWMDTQNTEMLYPTRVQATDYITIPDNKTGNVILVIMIAFPVVIALSGVLIWNRRRHA